MNTYLAGYFFSKKALNDMLLKLQKMYNSGEISEEMLIDKLSEAIEKMPDDAKMRLKEQNINLLQFIMNFIKDKKPEDENKNFENNEEEKRKKKPKKGINLLCEIH
jgi:hypothetical protein